MPGVWGAGLVGAAAGGKMMTSGLWLEVIFYPRGGGGNPVGAAEPGERGRSIPAQAGETRKEELKSMLLRVYPRAGGGTIRRISAIRRSNGLSPRRRGNHADPLPLADVVGSIPAQAGEPFAVDGIGHG